MTSSPTWRPTAATAAGCSPGCAAAGAGGDPALTPPLYLVDELPAGELAELSGPEARHAVTVRRTRVGERLLLGDGRGGLVDGEVAEVGRDALVVRVLARRLMPAPRPAVTLAQALVKGDRGELAVELATEAGVDAVLPWRAARCVARWDDGPRGAKALARWRATVHAAVKQSRRAWLPEVGEPAGTDELAARCDLVRGRGGAALVLHEAASVPIAAALREPPPTELLLVVGPEGGITEEERAALRAVGAREVRLGPEVLRASTAAAVALGALGALTQRWAHTLSDQPDVTLVRSSDRTV